MHFADGEIVLIFVFVLLPRKVRVQTMKSINPDAPFYLLGWNQAYSHLTNLLTTRLLSHQHGHLAFIEPKEEEYNYSLFRCCIECHSQFIENKQYKLVPAPTGRVEIDDPIRLSIRYTLKL